MFYFTKSSENLERKYSYYSHVQEVKSFGKGQREGMETFVSFTNFHGVNTPLALFQLPPWRHWAELGRDVHEQLSWALRKQLQHSLVGNLHPQARHHWLFPCPEVISLQQQNKCKQINHFRTQEQLPGIFIDTRAFTYSINNLPCTKFETENPEIKLSIWVYIHKLLCHSLYEILHTAIQT